MKKNLVCRSLFGVQILKKACFQMKFVLVLFLLSTYLVTAQEGTRRISGTVKNVNNEPLAGVTVKVKETITGTTTDLSGNYVLNVEPAGKTLVFSFVGMETQEIIIGTSTQINVTMVESAIGLEEVVVIGYGTMKKSDVTGAVISVSSKEITSRPVNNVYESMQGKAAGVDITTTLRPGTLGDITIRGVRSLTASNAPLYVVDGIPLMSSSNIEILNPQDFDFGYLEQYVQSHQYSESGTGQR